MSANYHICTAHESYVRAPRSPSWSAFEVVKYPRRSSYPKYIVFLLEPGQFGIDLITTSLELQPTTSIAIDEILRDHGFKLDGRTKGAVDATAEKYGCSIPRISGQSTFELCTTKPSLTQIQRVFEINILHYYLVMGQSRGNPAIRYFSTDYINILSHPGSN
ncbi:hypothetical protein L208DRAFT_768480 [Tricholoma matsutake]|nr:hypothetical protein L208DRAFT_768480 [Tricholoma matsutake 945]